jgi:hypothetical protein
MISLKNIKRNISNLPGWSSNRRIVIIESDDWGSIRMPSNTAFGFLEKSGLDLRSWDAERYNQNDTLATSSDLESLFGILSGIKDKSGNSAVFTAVSVMANPDFLKIKNSDFSEYFYEPFTDTLKKHPGCERSFDLWMEGIERKLFVPQMHGREHLNVIAWMRALKKGDPQTRLAFNEGVWGFVPDQNLLPNVDFQAAFLLIDQDELEYQKTVISNGLDLFEKLFGYRALYFVPPNGPFNNDLNFTLIQNGIKFRYAARIQHQPLGANKTNQVLHWLGQKEKSGLIYITRNCFFEPSQSGKDWIDNCLNDIKIAFRWKKPAIISSHRVNYIGALKPKNRDMGLTQLKILLQSIIKNWPEVEFLTTPELGKLMESNYYEK